MIFKEDEEVENRVCPKCGGKLFYEMGFQDCFSHSSGHYTVDVPLIVCDKCDYSEEVIKDESEDNI